jgi:hypothetical protein
MAMPRRTLSRAELLRAMLARQLLLERSTLSVPRALEAMGGLQAQYAPAMYVGLWSRLADLPRAEVTRTLVDREAVQGTLLRGTIHLVSARDYWPFAVGIREPRRVWWLRVAGKGVDIDSLEAGIDALHQRLRRGPLRRDELEDPAYQSLPANFWLDLLRLPPSGTWERRRADLFGLAETWIGPEAVTAGESQVHLVRRYLQAFGPAYRKDIATWAGLPVKAVVAALAELDTRTFHDEDGKELVDLAGLPLPDGDTAVPVRFLAVWDAMLLVHARRTQLLPEHHRARIFGTKTPFSFNTVLVDGQVAGTWRYAEGSVSIEWFDRPAPDVVDEAEAEAEQLAAFHAAPSPA